jgi:hypothetical protein
MTLDIQARIDAMSVDQLASAFCITPVDSPLFHGALGVYFIKRLKETGALALALSFGFRFSERFQP